MARKAWLVVQNPTVKQKETLVCSYLYVVNIVTYEESVLLMI